MADLHLLRKTELRIEHVELRGANLNRIAAVVAEGLGLDPADVLVTDVRDDVVALDVFRDTVNADRLPGRQRALLDRLAALPGVGVTEATRVSSDGVLGWIALDEGPARKALARSRAMAEEVRRRLSRRAIVFPTGGEVAAGRIEDTNTPMIARALEGAGYSVTRGPVLADDEALIAGRIGAAVFDDGHGLVITTGGVGAEDKDRTVEAVLRLDPDAATPYLSRFEQGTGRHCKDGVRIAVGRLPEAILVALPGPSDEVRACLEVLLEGLREHPDPGSLAGSLAATLRRRLRERMAPGSGRDRGGRGGGPMAPRGPAG